MHVGIENKPWASVTSAPDLLQAAQWYLDSSSGLSKV